MLAVYLAAAIYLMHALLWDPAGQVIAGNERDQANFEWMLTAISNQVRSGHNPLFSAAMNAPGGVNLMANPSMPLLSLAAVPLTVGLGPAPALALILTANLAASAGAWYWFFLRHPETATSPLRRRIAAALGGLLCGLSPAMVAHSWGHPNLTAQWLIPFIVDRALRLGRRESGQHRSPWRRHRSALILGLLIAAQIGIAEEPLFITVLALAAILFFRAAQAPRAALARYRPFLADSAVAGATAGVLAAYPLWFQFRGPQSYTGLVWAQDAFAATLRSYAAFAPTSVLGNPAQSSILAPNVTEASAFVGLPLLLAALAAAVAVVMANRTRRQEILALVVACAVLVLLSLGDTNLPDQRQYGIAGLPDFWPLLRRLPFFSEVLPVRLSLAVYPILAYLVLSGIHELSRVRPRAWWPAVGAISLCLLSLTPIPVGTQAASASPAFIAAGLWRQCADPGQTVLVYPTTIPAIEWSTGADQKFRIVGGVLFSPDSTGAVQLIPYRPTTRLLDTVDQSGTLPPITPELRAQAAADARYWGISCIALDSDPGGAMHPAQDRALLTGLFGPPVEIGSVWAWRLQAAAPRH